MKKKKMSIIYLDRRRYISVTCILHIHIFFCVYAVPQRRKGTSFSTYTVENKTACLGPRDSAMFATMTCTTRGENKKNNNNNKKRNKLSIFPYFIIYLRTTANNRLVSRLEDATELRQALVFHLEHYVCSRWSIIVQVVVISHQFFRVTNVADYRVRLHYPMMLILIYYIYLYVYIYFFSLNSIVFSQSDMTDGW